MDSPPQQPDLPRQRPTALPTITVGELEAQCQDLRTLLAATLVALLVLSVGLNLFLAKEQRLIRQKVSESRPTVSRLAAQFREKEPQMKAFLDALQNYAYSNPDFAPILERYKHAVPQYFQRTAPVSSAPAGLKIPTNALSRPNANPALAPAPSTPAPPQSR